MKSSFIRDLLETATRYESKVAFVDLDGSRSTTYGQLFALARKVAVYLRQEGVAPHSNICIRMPDTMEFMAAEIGVWLSRCAIVPIGMNSPEERVRTIAQNCESAMLIDEDVMIRVKDTNISDAEEITLPESTDDALIVYTSGSTGVPKGIIHTFEPFDRNYPHTFGLAAPSAEMVFGNGIPFYFMAIVFLYDMIRAGATIHLYSANVKTDAKSLQKYIMRHGITVSHISPAVLLRFHNRSPKLKAVITAGERLTVQCSKDGYTLYNLYGLSETSGTVTSCEVTPSSFGQIPLGICNPGIEFRIVGETGEDVPVGEEGELYLKGPFCKGYWKDPELTQKLYVNGWMHTGDIVSQGTDGMLYYKDRRDWMVKVNGQRVEPGEVEAAIRKLPEVEDTIVKGFGNGKGSQYLCAFYIAGREIDRDEFRVHLDRLIPRYMHPGAYVRMDSFPLNANGKVNRLVLTAPERESPKSHDEPKTERESVLLDIVHRVMGTVEIGVTDNLMDMGMDSISAIEIVNLADDAGIKIRASELLVLKTVREISKSVMSLVYWHSSFTGRKPILVFSCGIIGTERLENRVESLAEHFDILMVEPFLEHYLYLAGKDEPFDSVVGLYYDLMDMAVPDMSRIVAFMGFSFGGTISYELSRMLFLQTGHACKVICGDSPISFPHYVPMTPEQEAEEIRLIYSRDKGGSEIKARMIFEGYQAVLRLMSDRKAKEISSEILLFCCSDNIFGDLPSFYRECGAKVTVVEVPAGHTEFCIDTDNLWHDLTVAQTLKFLSGN